MASPVDTAFTALENNQTSRKEMLQRQGDIPMVMAAYHGTNNDSHLEQAHRFINLRPRHPLCTEWNGYTRLARQLSATRETCGHLVSGEKLTRKLPSY